MFSYIANRSYFYAVAGILVLVSIVAPLVLPLNMGIDLTGGTQTEYQYVSPTGSVDTVISAARTYATDLKKTFVHATQPTVNDVNIYRITGTENFIVEAGFSLRSGMTDIDLEKVKQDFHDQLSAKLISVYPTGITQVRYQNVGEAFGSYIRSSAVRTLALAIVMISLYIMYAFWGSIRGMSSWPFAVVTGVSLVHDVVVAAGLYVIVSYFFPEFKIDIFFITAMLTVLWYSINDTIVVMDRIRSNLADTKMAKMEFGQLIDYSIGDTLTRSIFTSLTVFIVVLCMFLFGPEALRGFTLALLFGTIVGTYSSVCIAAPMLYDITRMQKNNGK